MRKHIILIPIILISLMLLINIEISADSSSGVKYMTNKAIDINGEQLPDGYGKIIGTFGTCFGKVKDNLLYEYEGLTSSTWIFEPISLSLPGKKYYAISPGILPEWYNDSELLGVANGYFVKSGIVHQTKKIEVSSFLCLEEFENVFDSNIINLNAGTIIKCYADFNVPIDSINWLRYNIKIAAVGRFGLDIFNIGKKIWLEYDAILYDDHIEYSNDDEFKVIGLGFYDLFDFETSTTFDYQNTRTYQDLNSRIVKLENPFMDSENNKYTFELCLGILANVINNNIVYYTFGDTDKISEKIVFGEMEYEYNEIVYYADDLNTNIKGVYEDVNNYLINFDNIISGWKILNTNQITIFDKVIEVFKILIIIVLTILVLYIFFKFVFFLKRKKNKYNYKKPK